MYANTGRRIALQPIVGKRSRKALRCLPRVAFAPCDGGFVYNMPTVADFQNYAAVCTRLARATDTEASKTTLLMMAEKWSGLAAQAERVRQLVREADALFDASTSAPERLSDLSLSFDAHAAPSRRDA